MAGQPSPTDEGPMRRFSEWFHNSQDGGVAAGGESCSPAELLAERETHCEALSGIRLPSGSSPAGSIAPRRSRQRAVTNAGSGSAHPQSTAKHREP